MIKMNSPGRPTWLRFSAFLLGAVILVWLTIEETREFGVLVISGLICTWGAAYFLYRTKLGRRQMVLWHVAVGGMAGLLLAPLAILLMALKSGIHGHGTPDFTPGQLQAILSRARIYILAGILIGAGSGLLRGNLSQRN
jgi:hypothetical protein